MTNRQTIIAGIIATVMGGIILATLGSIWESDWAVWFKTLWGFLTWEVTGPLYAISILAVFSLLYVHTIVSGFLKQNNEQSVFVSVPVQPTYLTDTIGGHVWRWKWGKRENSPWDLKAFCPECDYEYLKKYSGYGSGHVKYECPICDTSDDVGNENEYIGAVQKEIERRYRAKQG